MSLTGTLGRDEERFVVDGKEYVLATPTLGAMVAAERELRRHALNPLRRAAEQAHRVPVEHAREYWRLAYEAERTWNPTIEELQATVSTEVRLACVALVLLYRHHRTEIDTLEKATTWLEKVDLGRFDAIADTLMPPGLAGTSEGNAGSPPTGAA